MKKLVFFVIAFLVAQGALKAQVKVVLVEEGTGTWCQYCPRGDVYSKALHEAYPDNALFVAVHNGDDMANQEYTDAMGLSGYPSGNIDRVSESSLEPTMVNSDMAPFLSSTPPVGVAVTTSFNDATRELDISVSGDFTQDLSGDYRFAAIVVEDGVTGPSPSYDQSNAYSGGTYGPMGGYENLPSPVPASLMVYDHVGRYLAGGYDGQTGSLPASITNGETHSYDFSYTVPSDYNEAYIYVIGLVINGQTGEVVNAGKSLYLPGHSNGIPFFHSEPLVDGFVGLNYAYEIVTHDPENDDLTITATTLPSWLSLTDNGDGQAILEGAPESTGSFDVVLNLSDGEWNIEQSFTIVVGDATEDWVLVGSEGIGMTDVSEVALALDASGVPYIMSSNYSLSQLEVYKYETDSWVKLGTSLPATAFDVAMTVSPDGVPYVFDGQGKVYKYDQDSWQQVGSTISSTYHSADLLYISDVAIYLTFYTDMGVGYVYKYDGSSWTSMSSLPDNIALWGRFKADSDNNPVLLYATGNGYSNYSRMAYWDGAEWQQAGSGDIESGFTTYFSHDVALNSSDEIFAGIILGASEQKLNVYQYNGSSWDMIGENIAGGASEYCQMEVNNDDDLIVAFKDAVNGGKTSVMKYDGENWNYMGQAGFTNIATHQALAIDPEGNPYVAYSDDALGGAMSVKKYVNLSTGMKPKVVDNASIDVYPNPNNGTFRIKNNQSDNPIHQVEIIDVSGRTIKVYNKQDSYVITLNEGVYFVKIATEKSGIVKKVIVD